MPPLSRRGRSGYLTVRAGAGIVSWRAPKATMRANALRGVAMPHHQKVQGHGPAVDDTGDTGAERITAARTWFDVVRDASDQIVPARADWVVLHVRNPVIQLLREGNTASLTEAGIGTPQTGEGLALVLLRHHDGDLEVTLHRVVQALSPRVGDPYGAGRVTETGVSRLASVVDPAHLRALTSDTDTLAMLEQLDLGGAVMAPVVAAGFVIGSLTLAHCPGSAVPRDARAVAEDLGHTSWWSR